MKNLEFQALSTYTLKADVDLLADGTKFFWGSAGDYAGTPNVHGKQVGNTALRHRITYYVKDATEFGMHMVYDLLESDDTGDETKTDTRPGVSRVTTRDDDDKDGWKEGTWS